MNPRRIALVLSLALVLLLTTTGAGFGAATTTMYNEKVPTNLSIHLHCANGGAGENVVLSGNLHLMTTTTRDASGGYHVQTQTQPQGIRGVGQTTGDKYQGTGITRVGWNTSGLPMQQTFVNNFRIIGQGPGNNYLVHEVIHITVNANGETTSYVGSYSSTCK